MGRGGRKENARATTIEKLLTAPLVGDTLGRWLRVSDQGLADEVRGVEQAVAGDVARTQLDAQRAVEEMRQAEQASESYPEWIKERMAVDRYFAQHVMYLRAQDQARTTLTPGERAIMMPSSRAARAEHVMRLGRE
jgi:hypothetical protein